MSEKYADGKLGRLHMRLSSILVNLDPWASPLRSWLAVAISGGQIEVKILAVRTTKVHVYVASKVMVLTVMNNASRRQSHHVNL